MNSNPSSAPDPTPAFPTTPSPSVVGSTQQQSGAFSAPFAAPFVPAPFAFSPNTQTGASTYAAANSSVNHFGGAISFKAFPTANLPIHSNPNPSHATFPGQPLASPSLQPPIAPFSFPASAFVPSQGLLFPTKQEFGSKVSGFVGSLPPAARAEADAGLAGVQLAALGAAQTTSPENVYKKLLSRFRGAAELDDDCEAEEKVRGMLPSVQPGAQGLDAVETKVILFLILFLICDSCGTRLIGLFVRKIY